MRIALPLLTVALHFATAGRYGYFRDELYFIACARRLAWGYVDQPPLVAIAAWLAAPTGFELHVLRLLPALAAGATVAFAMAIARLAGGGRFAQLLTGIAVAFLPAYALLGNVLTTTSFEPLTWTVFAYAILSAAKHQEPRWWYPAAAAFTVGFYAKYSIVLFAACVVVALVASASRGILRTKEFALAAAGAIILTLPNVLWQWSHTWPMLAVLRGDFAHRHTFQSGLLLESQDMLANARAFLTEQLLYTNPMSVPIWIAGLFMLFAFSQWWFARWYAAAFVLVVIAAVVLQAKGYYVIAAYAPLVAFGTVTFEAWSRRRADRTRVLQTGTVVVFLAFTVPFLPLSLPVLPIDTFVRYSVALRLTPASDPHVIQPVYAEEFGWEGLTRAVAREYSGLPSAVRARTAIFADTYADASALDFYGRGVSLPAAVSGQNTYWLWGTHGFRGTTLLAVGATQTPLLQKKCATLRLLRTFTEPRKWVVEGPTPIYFCTLRRPLDLEWSDFKWYGA